MSLFIKHRPKDFSEFVGNAPIVKSVKTLLEKGDVPHSWLFTGNSGGGKTTLARIIAKAIGAKKPGIYEINTADLRGIDGIREIAERVNYRAPGSPVSVFVLDECHQLTKEAQNALLKILEDTPKHAYFILCTTDPQKLIGTIRTRCTEFKLKPLPDEEIGKLLISIVDKEKISWGDEKLEEDILHEVIEACGGSPRLALNMLEKVSTVSTPKEARDLVTGLGIEFQTEGDFTTAKLLFDKLIVGGERDKVWRKIAKVLDESVYAPRASVPAVKQGLTSLLGRAILNNGSKGIADAILTLESSQNLYSNASFSGIMFRVVEDMTRKEKE